MKKILAALFVFSTAFFLYSCGEQGQQNVPDGTGNTSTDTANDDNTGTTSDTGTGQSIEYTIKISSTGFGPFILTIKSGDKVTFVNEDTAEHWPASASHPTHTVYPGSGIEKCGTSEQPDIFDACRGLKENESFSFVFKEKGEWKYHDHLNPGLNGAIIVR